MPVLSCPSGAERKPGAPDVVYIGGEDFQNALDELYAILAPFIPVEPWVAVATDDLCANPPSFAVEFDVETILAAIRRDWTLLPQIIETAVNFAYWYVWNTYCQCAAAEVPPGDDCYDPAVAAATPLLYYRLDESAGSSAGDSSGNGYTGTLTGTYTLGSDGPFARTGIAAANPGGKIERTGITVATGRYGAMGWIYPTAYHVSPNNQHWIQDFYSSVTGGQQDHVGVFLQASNATTASLQFRITRSGGAVATLAGGGIPLNQWTHVAVIHEADGTMRTYVNGAQSGSSAAAHNFDLRGASNGWFLGLTANGSGDYFQGNIANWSVHKDLSVAQVVAAYDAGVNGCVLDDPTPIDTFVAPELPATIPAPPAYSCDEATLCIDVEAIRIQLVRIQDQINVIQRQAAPFGYQLVSTHTLSSSGSVSVSGILAVAVDFTVIPAYKGQKGVGLIDRFDLGWIGWGTADGTVERIQLRHDPQLLAPIPGYATVLRYDLAPGVSAQVKLYRRLN